MGSGDMKRPNSELYARSRKLYRFVGRSAVHHHVASAEPTWIHAVPGEAGRGVAERPVGVLARDVSTREDNRQRRVARIPEQRLRRAAWSHPSPKQE